MRLNKKLNKTWIGLSAGILIPVMATVVFYFAENHTKSYIDYLGLMVRMDILSHIVSICALPNLLIFFIFIWSELYYSARGVVFATMIWAFFVLILRFFI
jgi:hypothetical protein